MNKILMPSGGQTSDESVITRWLKQTGEKIARGDILCEIETDKAVLEVESFCEGILRAIVYGEGETVISGDIIAYIGGADEELSADQSKQAEHDDSENDYRPVMKNSDVANSGHIKEIEIHAMPTAGAQKTLISPLAKKMARDADLNISVLVPGNGNVIKKQDVLDYLASPAGKKGKAPDEYEDIPITPMRAAIAERMTVSVAAIPQFTISVAVDMTECMLLRGRLNDDARESGLIKIGYNDIIMKCAAQAVKLFPMVNSSFGDSHIRVYKNINIGLAVSVRDGLVVPVIRGVGSKSLSEIAAENIGNIKKAGENKLKPEDMRGGTMTVSNLGMIKADWFTAIINPPESCILAIGLIHEQAVSIKGQIVSRQMMNICASFDHRTIDGAYGAVYLAELKRLLEKPWLLFL